MGGHAICVVDAEGVVRFAARDTGSRESLAAMLARALAGAGRHANGPRSAEVQMTRRELVVTSLVVGFTVAFAHGCAPTAAPVAAVSSAPLSRDVDLTLRINGADRALKVDPRVTLLDLLREGLGMTGTKKGCDMGQCGACTVLVDGRRVNSCLALAASVNGAAVTTIEGLAPDGDKLHPVQAAFLAEDGFQCGYCTPGQIMSAVALLAEGHATSDDEIRERMSGNICRCGAYPNIVAAIRRAQGGGA